MIEQRGDHINNRERDVEMGEAFGAMGECVMALYGIARLLGSRSVGAAKITPAIETFRGAEAAHCREIERALAEIAVAAVPSAPLCDAAELLREEAREVAEQVHELLANPGRLAARERLELERGVRRLGARLDAVRWLATVVRASLRPRAARLRLGDLLGGSGVVRRAFATEHLEVMLPCGGKAEIHGDPTVLRALIEHGLRATHEAGTELPFAQVRSDAEGVRIELGETEPVSCTTIERVMLPLGVPLDCQDRVLAAVAAASGIRLVPGAEGMLISMLVTSACA